MRVSYTALTFFSIRPSSASPIAPRSGCTDAFLTPRFPPPSTDRSRSTALRLAHCSGGCRRAGLHAAACRTAPCAPTGPRAGGEGGGRQGLAVRGRVGQRGEAPAAGKFPVTTGNFGTAFHSRIKGGERRAPPAPCPPRLLAAVRTENRSTGDGKTAQTRGSRNGTGLNPPRQATRGLRGSGARPLFRSSELFRGFEDVGSCRSLP